MSELFTHLKRVTDDLISLDIPFALVGGMAISLRTEPRFTRDVDIAVAVRSDDEAESIGRALLHRGYRVQAQVEQERADRLATLRLLIPDAKIVVDLLFASCGIEPEIVQHAEQIEALPGWQVPVATPPYLLAMKLLATDPVQRPQDMIDARLLVRSMSSDEHATCRQAIQLIEQRGFHRGRSLGEDLDQLLANASESD